MQTMNQRQELLSLLCGLRDLSGTENQALRELDLSRVDEIQVEKESLRKQIDELEAVPEGELSCHAADVEVKQVVAQIMLMDRESNEHLLREMDTFKGRGGQAVTSPNQHSPRAGCHQAVFASQLGGLHVIPK